MRTASIYIILGTVAIMDIISMSYDLHIEILKFYRVVNVCFSKEADYNILIIQEVFESVRSYTRRCSTWLSVSIALIRVLVIKYPMNSKFDILSKSKTAFIVIPFILILCAPLHIMDIYKYQIILLDENYKCTQFPFYTTYYYVKTTSLLFFQDDALLFNTYRNIDGIISKIIPCILFPIITFLLILEIRKQRIKRNKLKSSFAPKESKHTTKFVLFLTLPFFLAELPLGIIFMIRSTFLEGTWSSIFMEAFENLFLLILSGTTALHMVICIFMSSQYREVAWSTIRFGYVLEIIPCILFPVITFLLILEIRKQRINRDKLKSSFAPKESKNTTKFVLFLTLPFFLAELPLGIIFMISPPLWNQIGSYLLMEGLENFFSFILSGTTTLHMFVCIFMSSQYREVAWSTIRFGYVLEEQQNKPIFGQRTLTV
ncbi:hypothetical protein GCK72_021728 [Caenorhabditis remanei]|uniref:G-protein coupled receptors family 1 profile domain-containing protein n=1 Tax=Caenorhabditis remanei TaxID=31234 RepID=A0A6A5GLK1_CAERE|nr:hypothetical protein GCK72_021728 [Caenorhabditis remanei]KAF1755159.1 hypothetical protein GCK72_021728 [Caenorhabditis remanei]